MAFDYNPNDKADGGGRAVEGAYQWAIDDIEEVTFRTGNSGWKLRLSVGAFPDRDITVFDNIVNVPAALWRMAQLCASIGEDFNSPPQGGWDPLHFIGKSGKADFEVSDRGYLQVREYHAANANNGPDTRNPAPMANEPPPHGDADIPF